MITTAEASQLIAKYTNDFGTETISLGEGVGRVIREVIVADRDFPPYDRVTMDGIAIRHEDFQAGTRTFKIAGIAAAGAEQMKLDTPNECLEVMTGAIMPEGLDTVIRYEDLEIQHGIATIQVEAVKDQQNVHFKGFDRKQGDPIILSGKKMGAPEVGVCATVGKHRIEVSRVPKTLIISSGDELIEIEDIPAPHQIRQSNVHQLKNALKTHSVQADTAHLLDDYETIVRKLRHFIKEYDLILLSGGVSKGKFDFLPKALEEVGIEKHFHRVAQRPGKPFWFGTKDQLTVFAFPGNPVSSFMCLQQYLIPWLNQCLKLEDQPQPKAVLSSDVTFKPDLTYFLEVSLTYSPEGQLLATPVKGNGSGDLANLVDADAFIVLPSGRELFKKGEAHPVIFYR